ncbi:chemotaxis-specific protein-glutamate methyltransferase CheB [Telmatobacter sp. DSM 110680]|uniref:Protein-glutamate methylesterase/protein-glutamine glutaminase n=1 Tax=Telmatobacter sp. DSM 110680 TaxID=3036704 RepID=A0AAU7DGZ6_9BACT
MAHGRRTRILIVDDSAVMRSLIRSVILADPSLEVAGSAADGAAALQTIDSVRPDLVLLDVEMPNLCGLETLRSLRARGSRTPVVMVSALTQRGARVTIDALASGASDYVTKPSNQDDRESALRTLAQDLLPKIRALTVSSVSQSPRLAPVTEFLESSHLSSVPPSIVVIGVSTGGPAALDVLLSSIPSTFPLPILIVQHMPELFTRPLAERLSQSRCTRVYEATEGSSVLPGSIFLARGNWHMEVIQSSRHGAPPTLHLQQGPFENHCRPSVDVLFRSAAAIYGPATLAVVLTGMGSDGLASCRTIRAQGGTVLAQDQATSAVWGMPRAVVQAGLAQRVLPLSAIAPEMIRLASRNAAERFERRECAVQR